MTENQTVKVKVLSIGDDGKVSLSMKKAVDPPARSGGRGNSARPARPGGYEWQSRRNEGASFEDMMSRFKQTSDEKMSDLKRVMDGKRGGFNRRGGGNQYK